MVCTVDGRESGLMGGERKESSCPYGKNNIRTVSTTSFSFGFARLTSQ